MLTITQIPNLFSSDLKLTTCVIPKEVLHPQIESDIITKYGDDIKDAWIIRVLDTKSNIFVTYTCLTSSNGNMYKVDYIEVSPAYLSGYNVGNKGFDITMNPYHTSVPEHLEWIKGYHEGYKHALEPNTPI